MVSTEKRFRLEKMASPNKLSMFALAVCTAAAMVGQQNQVDAFDPLVETGTSKLAPEGRHVAVHVPAFFNMNLDTRGRGQGARLSQSVMSGLVKIFIDREKQGDSFAGPIRVKVAGLTMYDNEQPELSSSANLVEDGSGESPVMGRLGSLFSRQSRSPQTIPQ